MEQPPPEPPPELAGLDERDARRLLAIEFAITQVLAEAETLAQATPRILEAICLSLTWELGQIYRLDAESGVLQYVDGWGPPGADVELFEHVSRNMSFRHGIGLPGRVWATGGPVWITDVGEDESFMRGPAAAQVGLRSAFGFPIYVGNDLLGVMEFLSRQPREPDEELLSLMGSVGGQLGQFMARRQTEEASLEEIQVSRRRLAFLAEASRILSASLDYEKTLAKLARLVVPEIADWCVVELIEPDGSVRVVGASHRDPPKEDLAKELREWSPGLRSALMSLGNVTRTGRSELYREITDEAVESAARDPAHLRTLRGLDLRSAMVVSLMARGRTLGTISLVSGASGRRYDPEDLTFVEDLAARAAMAIDNARLYGERSRIARTLQRSLLPPKLPVISGLDISARYLPAGEANEVGGDFYDVFAITKRSWIVTIGDVQGKGPEAATVTGLARHTLRVAAMQTKTPSEMLRILNDALLLDESDRFLTVAVAHLRFTKLGASVTVACGGHPPPLLRRKDGSVIDAGCIGTLIGVFPDPELDDEEIRLKPGDTLMFYTDGLTSERGPGQGVGPAELASVLEQGADLDADQISRTILDAVEQSRQGPPTDDIALLVLQLIP